MKKFIKTLLLVLFAAVLIALAVANRHPVRFVVDPFIDRNAAYALELPLYIFLFCAMLAGLIIGGATVWVGQSYWRKTARLERKEAVIWKREAENLKKGLQAVGSPSSASRHLRIS